MTVFITIFIAAAACQALPPSVNKANHFYWSENKAHELDYEHTIATAKELLPAERKSLLTFMLNRFQDRPSEHDKMMFQDTPNDQLRKLAVHTRIEFADLSGGATKEIIAQGNGLGPCGGTGNCLFMVLKSTPAGWKTLLDTHVQFSGGFEKIRLLNTSTNGYRDMVIAAHVTTCEREAIVLAYDKKKYRQRECYHINWCADAGTRLLPQPEIGACQK